MARARGRGWNRRPSRAPGPHGRGRGGARSARGRPRAARGHGLARPGRRGADLPEQHHPRGGPAQLGPRPTAGSARTHRRRPGLWSGRWTLVRTCAPPARCREGARARRGRARAPPRGARPRTPPPGPGPHRVGPRGRCRALGGGPARAARGRCGRCRNARVAQRGAPAPRPPGRPGPEPGGGSEQRGSRLPAPWTRGGGRRACRARPRLPAQRRHARTQGRCG